MPKSSNTGIGISSVVRIAMLSSLISRWDMPTSCHTIDKCKMMEYVKLVGIIEQIKSDINKLKLVGRGDIM